MPPAEAMASIVIRSYNCRPFIAAAIESALGQSFPRVEVVVVDDGSTDGTAEVVETYRTRCLVLRQPNRGQAAALNAGFAAASGDYVAFLDGDDILDRDALAVALAGWEAGTVRACFALRVVDAASNPTGQTLAPTDTGGLPTDILFGHPELVPHVATSANVHLRSALARIMPLPELEWRQAPDLYLDVLGVLVGRIRVIHRTLGSYRVHGANLSLRWTASLDLLQARAMSFARIESAAWQRRLRPPAAGVCAPPLIFCLIRVLSYRLGRTSHGFADETRWRLSRLIWRSLRAPHAARLPRLGRIKLAVVALAALLGPLRLAQVCRGRYLLDRRMQGMLRTTTPAALARLADVQPSAAARS